MINVEYISALEERDKIQSAFRAFQNFMELIPKEDMPELRPHLLEIEKILIEKRNNYDPKEIEVTNY